MGERNRYGPGGYLSWEKVYNGNGQWCESAGSFVRGIIDLLAETAETTERDQGHKERRKGIEPSGDNHGKGTHGTAGHRRDHHVTAKAERPALYTAQSYRAGLPGERGAHTDPR